MTGCAGVTSPNARPSATCSAGSRNWPGKKMTLYSSSVRRRSSTVRASSSRFRSTPRISAPIVADNGVIRTSTGATVAVIGWVLLFESRGSRNRGGRRVERRMATFGALVDTELGEQVRAHRDKARIAAEARRRDVDAFVTRDATVGEHHHAVGEQDRFVDIVGHEEHGRPVAAAELLQQHVHADAGER